MAYFNLKEILFSCIFGDSGSGSSLPKISAADDGKVLTAQGGAWVAKDIPDNGGSGSYKLTEADKAEIVQMVLAELAAGGTETPDQPVMISFTIDGKTYQAEEGMTWGEWVENTSYNTDGYYISNNYDNNEQELILPNNDDSLAVANSGFSHVHPQNTIVSNEAYTLVIW